MMTEDEVIHAVEVAADLGITKIRITGGEPLVKKNIVSICRRAAAVDGIKEVCLTTNGVLLPHLAKDRKAVQEPPQNQEILTILLLYHTCDILSILLK